MYQAVYDDERKFDAERFESVPIADTPQRSYVYTALFAVVIVMAVLIVFTLVAANNTASQSPLDSLIAAEKHRTNGHRHSESPAAVSRRSRSDDEYDADDDTRSRSSRRSSSRNSQKDESESEKTTPIVHRLSHRSPSSKDEDETPSKASRPASNHKRSSSRSNKKTAEKSPFTSSKPNGDGDMSAGREAANNEDLLKAKEARGEAKDATKVPSSSESSDKPATDSPLTSGACEPPYPGYPFCESKVAELQAEWRKDADTEAFYRAQGIDGNKCSFLTYLNQHGFYCPEAADWNRQKIRGVNLGGWLVLEPWITPHLFTQFAEKEGVRDQWRFCTALGKAECTKQLTKHWDEWLSFDELQELYDGGINHVRIPVGYWLFGDIQDGEPWVTGDLYYLERAVKWCGQIGLHVILDLHCAPGSQNGFDNSGRMGEIHFADSVTKANGRVVYPNIERALTFIDKMTQHFSANAYTGIVVGIELVNEAFISIPIEIVKDYYLQGYAMVKQYGDIAVIIGDSFRFGAWDDFMFPPHYRHVWIDTHIYQVFDNYRLSFTEEQHLEQTCEENKPEIAVAPLSTMVGEWSLATNDCARWLNGYQVGARYDGTFSLSHPWEPPAAVGSCVGWNDINNSSIWTPEYKKFLKQFAEVQMDAYESGSAAGWFFWNFKAPDAPQWDYLTGLREGWMPTDHNNRKSNCDKLNS